IGRRAARVLEVRLRRLVLHIYAGARRGELPAVIHAAESALFVATEEQRGAAVRTIVLQQADFTVGIPKRDQILTQQAHPLRRSVGLNLPAEQERNPVQPQQIAHGCTTPDAGDELVVGGTQHAQATWCTSAISRCSRADCSIAIHTSMVALPQRPSCSG